MRLLLAADGSPCTHRAVAWLVNHQALLEGGEVIVFHAQPHLPPRVEGFAGHEQLRDYRAHEAAAVLAPLEEFLRRHGIACRTAWTVGQPSDAIVQAARDEHAHLVLLGSHGHGAVAGLLLGSVAQRVLAHAEVPVLLVR